MRIKDVKELEDAIKKDLENVLDQLLKGVVKEEAVKKEDCDCFGCKMNEAFVEHIDGKVGGAEYQLAKTLFIAKVPDSELDVFESYLKSNFKKLNSVLNTVLKDLEHTAITLKIIEERRKK